MRRNNIQQRASDKLSKITFKVLVRLRQIMLKSKLEPTMINLTLVKLLILISGLQEMQIVTKTTDEQFTNKNIQSTFVSIFNKFSINLIDYNQDAQLLSIFLATEITYLIILIIILLDKEEKFPLLNKIFQYFQVIFHQIVFLPVINVSCNLALTNNFIGLSIIVIFLGLIFELIFTLSNVLNNLIEIEGCYTIRSYNIINTFLQFLLCFFVQNYYNDLISPLILLVSKISLLYSKIYSFHFNGFFLLQITNFIISYVLTKIFQQHWFDIILIHLLFINLQSIIRLRKLNTEISKFVEKPNLFYYQLIGNEEFKSFSPHNLHYFSTVYSKSIQKFEKYAMKEGIISERLAVLLHVYKFKKIQLYLNLITINKENLNYNHKINLEANLLNLIQICKKLITSQLNIPLYMQSLQVEQQNFQFLIDFLNLKSQFFVLLSKDSQINKYLKNFSIQLNKILQTLEKYKNIFENQYDIQFAKLKSFNNTDSISINIICSYLFVFYGNFFKVRELQKKRNDLLIYDKVINIKLQKNEAFLVQSSFIKGQSQIINKNNKRFFQIFGLAMEPKLLTDIMPVFQKNIYNNFISQFLISGFDIQQPLQIFLNRDEFLIECDLYVFVIISNDDIVIQNLIILKNQPNHFVNFDTEGRILGISKEIFTFFTNKSENVFNKKLSVGDFVSQGMIQYYMPDIYSLITDLQNLQKQGNLATNLWIVTRWQFPVNHKKCLEQTNSLGLVNDDCATPSQFKKIFYSSSTKRLLITKATSGSDELPIIKNVKIKIMQKSIMSQIQALVVPASRLKSIDFEGSLEFNVYRFANEEQSFFNIKFKQIEEYQQEKNNADDKNDENQNFSLNLRENIYDGLQQDYEFISNMINSKKLYTPLKYNIAIKIIMILVTITALVVCYFLNFDNMVQYQQDVNFLNTPQAMTFNIAASFILQWNYYCVENKLFKISPYLEYKRENQLIYVFGFWGSIHEEYSMNLSKKSKELGIDNISLITYVDNIKKEEQVDFYQFYTVMREAMVRQFKKVDFKNSSTFDPSVLLTTGLVRQNMLSIYKFHNYVLDEVISQTQTSFIDFQNKTFIFCIYSSAIIVLLLIIFIFTNIKLLSNQAKLIKLFQFLNQKQLQDELEYIQAVKDSLSKLLLQQPKLSQVDTPLSKNSEKKINIQQSKTNPLSKLYYYKESYSILIIISIIIGAELILFIFGSQFVALLYNTQYQNSLILTMKYLKLKCRTDSAVMIGEMIKTEHLIKNNTSMNFINETDHIQFLFENVDVAVNLSNNINDELSITTAYNSSFKLKLIQIFNENLCKYYSSILSFCNVENINLPYFENENYINLIDNGIFGIVQDFNKLVKQEFSYEYVNLKYEYDQLHSQSYLNTPIHDHLFLQYFIEIQTCIYFCFLEIFEETQNLSYYLSQQILIYLISSSGTFLFMTSLISGFWINRQYKRLNQLKLIVTLFPPTLIQQKSFSKLLYSHLSQIQ